VTGRGFRRITAKPQAGNTSECDRADLRNRCAAEEDDQRGDQGDGCAFPVGAERARHAPNGLSHDDHGDQLQAVQQSRPGRAARRSCIVGEQHEHDCRGQGEAGSRSERATIAGAHQTDGKSDLAAGRN
jgi:hypothetical protein